MNKIIFDGDSKDLFKCKNEVKGGFSYSIDNWSYCSNEIGCTRTLPHSNIHSFSLSPSRSRSHTYTNYFTLTHSHTHTQTHTHTHLLTHTHTHTHIHTHTYTHTIHTHTYSLTHHFLIDSCERKHAQVSRFLRPEGFSLSLSACVCVWESVCKSYPNTEEDKVHNNKTLLKKIGSNCSKKGWNVFEV